MNSDRIPYCVPFCQRTRKRRWQGEEWICGKHWTLVPSDLKRRKRKLKRLYYRAFNDLNRTASVQFWIGQKMDQTWEKCKRAAIDRAAGV